MRRAQYRQDTARSPGARSVGPTLISLTSQSLPTPAVGCRKGVQGVRGVGPKGDLFARRSRRLHRRTKNVGTGSVEIRRQAWREIVAASGVSTAAVTYGHWNVQHNSLRYRDANVRG